jgi:hypothetical protein
MVRYIIKQFKRSTVSNALYCLLLTLAGALLCVSAGLWFSAHKALLDIDSTVTTIAMPDYFAIWQKNQKYIKDFEARFGFIDPRYMKQTQVWDYDEDLWTDVEVWDTEAMEGETIQTIRDTIYPSGLFKMDDRRVFNAMADGVTPRPMRMQGLGMEPRLAAFSPQAIAAFAVKCERIEVSYSLGWRQRSSGMLYQVLNRRYTAVFTVESTVLLHSTYSRPRNIRVNFHMNRDGSAVFEPGKRYALMGAYYHFGAGRSFLAVDFANTEITDVVAGHAGTIMEIIALLPQGEFLVGVTEDDLPVEIIENVFERVPDAAIFDLEDGWEPVEEALESIAIPTNSFQILTTDNPNSLFRLNQRRTPFTEGRPFNAQEAQSGARVCLVSRQFAEHNGLSVGDTLPLRMYNSVLSKASITYYAGDGAGYVTQFFWLPSWYHPGLEISEPVRYTIVGIFNTLTAETGHYAITPNTVIIPDKSVGTLGGEPVARFEALPVSEIPLLADGMIVPNGKVEETKALINGIADGYGNMLRFYEQGFETILTALRNLRFALSWVLALSVTGWATVVFMFAMFYVARKQKETAVLYAIGVSRADRFGWAFAQCAALILIALGAALAAALPLYGDMLDATGAAAEEFTLAIRDMTLSDAANTGIRARIPLDKSPFALLVTAIGGTALLLITAGYMSVRSAAFGSLSAGKGEH